MEETRSIQKQLYRYYFGRMALVVGGSLVLVMVVATAFLGFTSAVFVGSFVASVLLFAAFHVVSAMFYFRALTAGAVAAARYYMIHFFLLFVCAGVIVVLFKVVQPAEAKALMWAFLAMFMLTLVGESVVMVNIEKKLR